MVEDYGDIRFFSAGVNFLMERATSSANCVRETGLVEVDTHHQIALSGTNRSSSGE